MPAIGAGSKVAIDYGCIGGLIDVVADVQQQVDESNESNNTGSRDAGPC